MTASSTTAEEKVRLRRQVRAQLSDLSPEELRESDQALFEAFLALPQVEEARSILRRSIEVGQMMMVVGEEGTSAEDYILYQKGELLDAVYLQQNSFDPIDAACSPERQRCVFAVIYDVLTRRYSLTDKREIRGFFNQLRQEFLDWHNTEFQTPAFEAQQKKLTEYYLSQVV